ncbi:MAG: ribonuclease P protein component [Bacteroidetes bacterium]|nr:MAG: ribonuclease P protein component [Bacteroidota bacterium]
MGHTFTKAERLTSKKTIDALFELGTSFAIKPLRIIWLESKLTSSYPVQVVIVVPKKNISRAVDRNLIKRRLREAYRKNKDLLYEYLLKTKKQYAIAILFTGTEPLAYKEVEAKIILSLQRLIKENEKAGR